jgi:hypothetical protein
MANRIPNLFHFVFGLRKQTEPFHLVFYLCLESCLQVNRPDVILFHYCHEPYGPYWDLIRDKLHCVRVEANEFVTRFVYRDSFTRRYSYAHHADFVRLEKLLEFGGIYADIDTIFVKPIPAVLKEKVFVLGREDDVVIQKTREPRRSLCNAFIMSEKNAEFGRLWLSRMKEVFDGSWSRHSTVLPQELSEQHPDLIHIEPPLTFYRHMWTTEGIETLLRGCDRDVEGLVSFHLWSHLWWSRWRKDFSSFHAGLLTEDYVRSVDTTYNLVARRFLPPPRRKHAWFSWFSRRQAFQP